MDGIHMDMKQFFIVFIVSRIVITLAASKLLIILFCRNAENFKSMGFVLRVVNNEMMKKMS
jgi:hypothetical protein